MNSRLRRHPPKQRFAHRSGSEMCPIIFPDGLKIDTPSSVSPPPQPHQRLPSTSQRMPSGTPSAQLTNTRLLASVAPPRTSKGGSLNQTDPSDLHTTSFGELSCLP